MTGATQGHHIIATAALGAALGLLVCDLVLWALTGGDPQLTRRLLEELLSSSCHDRQILVTLWAQQASLQDIIEQAHKIKGAARLVGAGPLAEAAQAAAAAAKATDWAQVLPACADVATAVERLRRHLG